MDPMLSHLKTLVEQSETQGSKSPIIHFGMNRDSSATSSQQGGGNPGGSSGGDGSSNSYSSSSHSKDSYKMEKKTMRIKAYDNLKLSPMPKNAAEARGI